MKLSIDKFGGYLGYANKDRSTQPGIGFKLTSNNDYDIDQKRLTNIGDSIDPNDAVNLNYVKSNCLIYDGEQINIKKRKLTNVGDPKSDTDAVTKTYFENRLEKNLENCVKFNATKNKIDCKNCVLTNVSKPNNKADAVSLEYLKSNCLLFENGRFNANNSIITNIKEPIESMDVVSKLYVEKYVTHQIGIKCVTFGITNEINCKNYKLSNFKIANDPKDNLDAISKSYLDKELEKLSKSVTKQLQLFIKPENGELNLKNIKIYIDESVSEQSPTNLKQVNLILEKYIYVDDKNEININNAVIRNVKKPKDRRDAANKEYVDEAVRSNNTTFVNVLLQDLIKNFIKPNENGVIDFKTPNFKLIINASDNENAPVINRQLVDLKKIITSEMARMDEKLRVFYPLPSSSARSGGGEGKPIAEVIKLIVNDLTNLRSEIKKLKETKDSDDDKDDFWERVDKLNNK